MNTSEAIALAGSVRKLAKVLGISTQAIYNWGGTVPELRVYQLRDRMALQSPPSWVSTPDPGPSLAPPGD